MLKFLLVLIVVLVAGACEKPRGIVINVQIDDSVFIAEPVLVLGDIDYRLPLDTMGCAALNLTDVATPAIGTFKYGDYRFAVYISGKENFNIYLNVRPGQLGVEFQGEGALKNEIVNGKFLEKMTKPGFASDETTFITGLERMMQEYRRVLDSLKFDREFITSMEQKLQFRTFSLLGEYPEKHARILDLPEYKVSDFYITYLDSLIQQGETLSDMYECREAMLNWVNVSSTNEIGLKAPYPLLKAKLEYIDSKIQNPETAEYLADKYVMDYMETEGIDSLPGIRNIYDSKVKDPDMKDRFKTLYDQWKKIEKGQLSPSFKYVDIDTNEVNLEELRGKYVYIALWTNGQGREELPHFRELARRFKDKNIIFVGIYCGEDREAWKGIVKNENLGGIQLYADEDKTFTDAYRTRTLPRFILLDRDGRIVDAEMPRPSSRISAETIKKLEDI